MENTLYSLIEMQEIDMKLDKVREERGDLPERVESLTNVISEKEKLIKVQKQEVKSLTVENKNDLASNKETTVEIPKKALSEAFKKYWYNLLPKLKTTLK